MLKRSSILIVLFVLIFGALSISAATAQPEAQSYIVLANADNSVSASLLREIRAAGGTVTRSLSQLGMVVVTSSNPNFKSRLRSARSVVKNLPVHLIEPERIRITAGFRDVANPPVTGDDDFYFDLQWGADAVNAPEAWAAGRRGAGVRVAVLDEGVDADHPDLAPNVNRALSKSFVPGEDWNPAPGFYFNHGTHVAGIIAAADNAFGVIGMAPEAEIVAVKVLSEVTGSGTDDQVIAGIKYAADIGADIVNMSLGSGPLDLRGGCFDPADPASCYTTREVVETGLAYIRVVNYARRRGTSIIASAGNDAFDFRANRFFVHLPSDTPGVISVSALGPLNWATFHDTDLDVQTSYTNIGPLIDLSAPGGNFDYPGNESCTLAGTTVPCWVFDMVISDIPGGWAWAAGTSMAAPHVAGVAAQYIGANGGSMNPNTLQLALKFVADDKGAPGRDDVFGWGRVDGTLED